MLLNYLYNSFKKTHNLDILIGIEIEFYLFDIDISKISIEIIKLAKEYNITISDIKKEKGNNQFEIDLEPDNPIEIFKKIDKIKFLIRNLAKDNVRFEAKPFLTEPGSAMHFNITLHNNIGDNLFNIKNSILSDYLFMSISGILFFLKESMIFAAPNEESYDRYVNNFETPTNLSWGIKNRTTALRIDQSKIQKYNDSYRIEHRVSGVDCNYYLMLSVIIISIDHGINNKLTLEMPSIYGNSFDKQYNLEKLPISYKESLNIYLDSKLKNLIEKNI